LIGFLGIIADNAQMFKLVYEAFFPGKKRLPF